MKIAVLGSGGWGTALAMLLAENGHTVTLWSYLEEESRRLQQTRDKNQTPSTFLLYCGRMAIRPPCGDTSPAG